MHLHSALKAAILIIIVLPFFWRPAEAIEVDRNFLLEASAGYGLDIEDPAFRFGFVAVIYPWLRFNPSFNYYFITDRVEAAETNGETVEDRVSFTVWEMGANLHFVPVEWMGFRPYALAGLNFSSSQSSSRRDVAAFDQSSTRVGLNIGGGLEYDIIRTSLFAETRYDIEALEQWSVWGGVRFSF